MYFIPFFLVYLLLNFCLFVSIACLYFPCPSAPFLSIDRIFSCRWNVIPHLALCWWVHTGIADNFSAMVYKINCLQPHICFHTYKVLLLSSNMSIYKEKVEDLTKICLWNEDKAKTTENNDGLRSLSTQSSQWPNQAP